MNISKKTAGLLAVLGLAVGSIVTVGLQTKAQSTTPNAETTNTTAVPIHRDESKGGHVFNNITETVLIGDLAAKVQAAALAAVPGGAIQRVENDAEGAVYEAHMTKADGTDVTVKLDANYNVTSTEIGHGGGHDRPENDVETNDDITPGK